MTSQTESPRERLSTGQMLHLMRLEVERALRHDYPISCAVIGLDGFMKPEETEHRKTLMPTVFAELKAVTFGNDLRGLGVWAEQFQLAVFPHVTPQQITDVTQELLERARALESPLGEEHDVTLSIGIAHNLHGGPHSFESLVSEAETGMGLAMQAGGDRTIQAVEVESEIDRLRAELEAQIEEIQEHQNDLLGEDDEDQNWGKRLVSKTLEMFQAEPDQSEGVVRLKKSVVELLRTELAAWRATSSVSKMIESQRKIELLERRVTKLTESLGVTEAELKRVASMKNIDLGVASIYRSVQGLSADDDDSEKKGEMLKNIFEANMALRSQLAASEK